VGYVIWVRKSKKWVRLESHSEEVIGQKRPDRVAKNGRSEVPVVADQIGAGEQSYVAHGEVDFFGEDAMARTGGAGGLDRTTRAYLFTLSLAA